jgi:organic radical activating enzyme
MTSYQFIPYTPNYSFFEHAERFIAVAQTVTSFAFHLIKNDTTKFAASVEITDRCNAGCSYCYVYPREWTQQERVKGYLQLSAEEQRQKESQVFDTLQKLKDLGVVHVTLVGGEPTLAKQAIIKAAELFPCVWVVSNGTVPLPKTMRKPITLFVSMDGPPDYHNQSRDPKGFFNNHRYNGERGMTAAIARNINEYPRGAYIHLTLAKQAIDLFTEAVDWSVSTIKNLRGIVVSGTTASSKSDPFAYSIDDRQRLKELIAQVAAKYSWALFPFNQPTVNNFLFDSEHIIHSSDECSVSQRVLSLDFNGKSTGKCVLRDGMDCETCMCNITGLARATSCLDLATIKGVIYAAFG